MPEHMARAVLNGESSGEGTTVSQRFASFWLICLLASSPYAFSQETPEYDTVGAWSIRVDTSLDYGCFLYSSFEGGSEFRLGVDLRNYQIYLVVGDPDWQSIEYGKRYDVELKFGDETKWTAPARGFSFDPPENQPYLTVNLTSGDEDSVALFLTEFMEEPNFQVFYNGPSILNLNLTGSYQATIKLFECQEAMNSINEPNDPFAEPPRRKANDPFSS